MPGVDLLASAFNGANAAFIADLYAGGRRPGQRRPQLRGAVRRAERRGARRAGGRLRRVLGAATFSVASRAGGQAGQAAAPRHAKAAAGRRRGHAGAGAGRGARQPARADADPRLPGARPPGGEAGPAGPAGAHAASGAGPGGVRLRPGDLDRPIFIDGVLGRETATVREIIAIVRASYCGPIGVEFMHIQDPEQKTWIQRRIEGAPWTAGFDAGPSGPSCSS